MRVVKLLPMTPDRGSAPAAGFQLVIALQAFAVGEICFFRRETFKRLVQARRLIFCAARDLIAATDAIHKGSTLIARNLVRIRVAGFETPELRVCISR